MKKLIFDSEKSKFPCPVCAQPREIKQTKKKKPYIVCEPCGLQLFVRGRMGIEAFDHLAEHAGENDVWSRLGKLEKKYRVQCPKCGHAFWIGCELIKTNWFDGSFEGFQCPREECQATVPWE